MEIQVKVKSVYGTDKVYPACEKSHAFACIAKSKTLTEDTLQEIYRLGYEIKVVNTVFNLSDILKTN